MLQKTITVKEYAKEQGKTKEAIFYQIKKGKIKAQKNSNNEWEIILEEKENKKEKNIQNSELENKIKLLNQELELKDQLLKSKETIISSQNQTIEAEQRTNIALVKTCELLKSNEKNLLLENNKIKNEKKGFFARLFK
jgi:hypothetical protein